MVIKHAKILSGFCTIRCKNLRVLFAEELSGYVGRMNTVTKKLVCCLIIRKVAFVVHLI